MSWLRTISKCLSSKDVLCMVAHVSNMQKQVWMKKWMTCTLSGHQDLALEGHHIQGKPERLLKRGNPNYRNNLKKQREVVPGLPTLCQCATKDMYNNSNTNFWWNTTDKNVEKKIEQIG